MAHHPAELAEPSIRLLTDAVSNAPSPDTGVRSVCSGSGPPRRSASAAHTRGARRSGIGLLAERAVAAPLPGRIARAPDRTIAAGDDVEQSSTLHASALSTGRASVSVVLSTWRAVSSRTSAISAGQNPCRATQDGVSGERILVRDPIRLAECHDLFLRRNCARSCAGSFALHRAEYQ